MGEIKKSGCFFEEWRPVKGFENIYEVSSQGRVRSINHYAKIRNNGTRLAQGKILKPIKTCHGYAFVKTSSKYGSKHLAIHRLVATAFIENPNNYPCVNHKDEIKDNNCVSNLEWCNKSYNALYGTCQERLLKYKKKKVSAFNKTTGELIKTFDSMIEAMAETKVNKVTISEVCRGIRKSAGGYIWRYYEN